MTSIQRLVFAMSSALLIVVASPLPSHGDTKQPNPPMGTALELPHGVSAVDVPMRLVYGEVVIRVQINGRGMDFSFDSGSPQTYLNADVFKSLSLGGDAHAKTGLATLQIGGDDVTLRDVDIVSSPLEFNPPDQATKVVGTLGYDLLTRAVVRLDYANGKLDVMKPEAFTPPATATVIPVDVSGHVPIVTASVGSANGATFLVDTGAFTVIVLPHFTGAHPELFNASTQRFDVGSAYLRRLAPVCGVSAMIPYAVPDFRLGEIDVPNWLVLAPEKGSCFKGGSLDGLIGFDYLRLFTVTFDLPASRIYLELRPVYAPNASPSPANT